MTSGDEKISELYRSAAPAEQPPARLDAAILAEARREVSGTRRPATGPFSRSWMVPAALAAVLVLTVGLVTLMGPQEPPREMESQITEFATESAAPAPAAPAAVLREDLPRMKRMMEHKAVAPRTQERGAVGGMAADAPEPATVTGTDTDTDTDPGQWLQRIRELKNRGQIEEARRQLDEFRQQYPDSPLPDDLQF